MKTVTKFHDQEEILEFSSDSDAEGFAPFEEERYDDGEEEKERESLVDKLSAFISSQNASSSSSLYSALEGALSLLAKKENPSLPKEKALQQEEEEEEVTDEDEEVISKSPSPPLKRRRRKKRKKARRVYESEEEEDILASTFKKVKEAKQLSHEKYGDMVGMMLLPAIQIRFHVEDISQIVLPRARKGPKTMGHSIGKWMRKNSIDSFHASYWDGDEDRALYNIFTPVWRYHLGNAIRTLQSAKKDPSITLWQVCRSHLAIDMMLDIVAKGVGKGVGASIIPMSLTSGDGGVARTTYAINSRPQREYRRYKGEDISTMRLVSRIAARNRYNKLYWKSSNLKFPKRAPSWVSQAYTDVLFVDKN